MVRPSFPSNPLVGVFFFLGYKNLGLSLEKELDNSSGLAIL